MKRILTFTIVLFSFTQVWAQTANENEITQVRKTIDDLFESMRSVDSTKARGLFHPNARLMSTFEGAHHEYELRTGSLDIFIKAVGTPRKDLWDERISNVKISVDKTLAQAWMNYSFYINDEFSHCGVNAFQLYKDGDDWKIIQITDTRRGKDCN